MGRYYWGDIQGKFMFAVQPSDAGERFGAEMVEERILADDDYCIDYVVKRDKYDFICKELEDIESTGIVDRINDMFEKHQYGYNDKILKEFKITDQDMRNYADHRLGKKIIEYFDNFSKETSCYFEAEL